MEEKPCPQFNFPSLERKPQLGTKAGSSARNARFSPSMSGRSACDLRSRIASATFVLFNMAIDCKLRGCDLVRLKVRDVFVSGYMKERASVLQSKTQRPVQFEITEQTRKAVQRWIESPAMFGCDDLWPRRFHGSPRLSTRQYARILRGWVTSSGWSRVLTVRIRCAGRRPRRYTRRPATCGLFSFS
jgi:hypothetical protein